MKYRFNQRIKVSKGFYKSFNGVIKEFTEDKNGECSYNVELDLNGKTKNLIMNENELKPRLF